MDIVTLINDYGFPVVAVFFLAYFIWYLYNYIVNQIKPKLGSTSATLIKLIDRSTHFAEKKEVVQYNFVHL